MEIKIKILNWTIDSFPYLKDLLDESAGYCVSLEDEIEYFNPKQSHSWHYAVNNENLPVGFIRSFRQSGGFCRGEIYVPLGTEQRDKTIGSLIDKFIERFENQAGDRVRFDIPMKDLNLINALKSKGFLSRIELHVTSAFITTDIICTFSFKFFITIL